MLYLAPKKKQIPSKPTLVMVLFSICMITTFLLQIYIYGNHLPIKLAPAYDAANDLSRFIEVDFENPVEIKESYLHILDEFGIEEAYFEWETDYYIPMADENMKVRAYLNNNISSNNVELGKTVPADKRSEKGIIMPIEYPDSTVTLDGITLDVVRKDHQYMDSAYMPMETFLRVNPPIKKAGYFFKGTSLQENLDEIKEMLKEQLPGGDILYYIADPAELLLVSRKIFIKICLGEFLLLLVLCPTFYCIADNFVLDNSSARARETSPRKRALFCMIQGDVYFGAAFAISAILHAVCYPLFDQYLNSVPNIKYGLMDYLIMMGAGVGEAVFIQLILFLPVVLKHAPKLEKEA